MIIEKNSFLHHDFLWTVLHNLFKLKKNFTVINNFKQAIGNLTNVVDEEIDKIIIWFIGIIFDTFLRIDR